MFSVIVSDRKSDMENRQAIRPEQRKLSPSDYFSRNFSLMIISLNCRIFTPVLSVSRELSLLSSHSASYALKLPVFVQAALKQSAHSALYAQCVVSPLARGKYPFLVSLLTSVAFDSFTEIQAKSLVHNKLRNPSLNH